MELRYFWHTFGPLFLVNFVVLAAAAVFAVISRKRPPTPEIEERHSSVILGKWLREFWFWLTHPVFKFFVVFRVSPNAISILGTVVALCSAIAFARGGIGVGGWLLVLGASLDLFDGRVARALGRESRAGSYIDSCMDRISEGLTLAGIAYLYRDGFFFLIPVTALVSSQLTSYTRAKGEAMGVSYCGGIMQRPERALYLGAGAIVTPMVSYGLYPYLHQRFPELAYPLLERLVYLLPLSFVALFATVTSVTRIVNIMKLLDKRQFGARKLFQLQSEINSNKNPPSQ